jgi:hypothetical protein
MDEWIREQCGDIYETEAAALDRGWWDWIHGIGTHIGTDEPSRAA